MNTAIVIKLIKYKKLKDEIATHTIAQDFTGKSLGH
jgi:hypothetical protein